MHVVGCFACYDGGGSWRAIRLSLRGGWKDLDLGYRVLMMTLS